jgi:hypothetical protein
MLLVIYETAIATLALTHIAPPGDLTCGLDRQWARLFSSKNAQAIRSIQDRHQCCGLHSVVDRAWPFPDRSHTASSCVEAFDRQRSCLGGWRRDEQIAGGLMLFVAVSVFLLKVRRIPMCTCMRMLKPVNLVFQLVLLTVYRAEDSFFPATWSTHRSRFRTDDGSCDPHRTDQTSHIPRGQIEGPYRDDPLPEHGDHHIDSQGNNRATEEAEDRGPVMQPSGLQQEGTEWSQV